MLLRRIARPLLATWFVTQGVDAVRGPAVHVAFARPAVDTFMQQMGTDTRLSDAQLRSIVVAHGAVTAAAGLALAVGRAPRTAALLLAALTAAGAFAAFMSTASGLLVSLAGTVSYDLWDREGGEARPEVRTRRFRVATPLAMIVPAGLALVARDLDISLLVGWAFALAASTFCPLFVLGIWWRGLTARGAALGMAAGGSVATIGIALTLIRDTTATTVGDALLAQPAAVSVPVAFATMIAVSRLDHARRPRDVEGHMRALHAPEGLGLEAARGR